MKAWTENTGAELSWVFTESGQGKGTMDLLLPADIYSFKVHYRNTKIMY